jgi:hypothetical protein
VSYKGRAGYVLPLRALKKKRGLGGVSYERATRFTSKRPFES